MHILICVGAVFLSNIFSPVKSASQSRKAEILHNGAAWLQIFCCPAPQVQYWRHSFIQSIRYGKT